MLNSSSCRIFLAFQRTMLEAFDPWGDIYLFIYLREKTRNSLTWRSSLMIDVIFCGGFLACERLKSFCSWSCSINYGCCYETTGYFGQITTLEEDIGVR